MVIRAKGAVGRDFCARRGKRVGKGQFSGLVLNLGGGFLGLTQYIKLKLKGEGSEDPNIPPYLRLDKLGLSEGKGMDIWSSTGSECCCSVGCSDPGGGMAGNL